MLTPKNKVGRPIEKENRVKIGLSIDEETRELLDMLAESSGKTKSKVFKEAIKLFKANDSIVRKKLKILEEIDDNTLLDFYKFYKKQQS